MRLVNIYSQLICNENVVHRMCRTLVWGGWDGMGFVSPISGVGFTIVVVNSYGTENEKLEEKVEILMYT